MRFDQVYYYTTNTYNTYLRKTFDDPLTYYNYQELSIYDETYAVPWPLLWLDVNFI